MHWPRPPPPTTSRSTRPCSSATPARSPISRACGSTIPRSPRPPTGVGSWRASSADLAALRSREQQIAFWVNAYNILAIDLVAAHYPVASIRDIGSLLRPVWKRPAGTVGGRNVTLDEIEHGIVRPFGDPRTHAVVVCASTSCPALPREPLTAARLDAQLDAAVRAWLADRDKGMRIDRAAQTVHLSKIFDWFEEDFAKAGGVVAFAIRYAPEADRDWLRAHAATARIDYFDYDWAVNALTSTR